MILPCLTYFLLIRLSRRFCVGDQGRRLVPEGPGHGLYAAPRPQVVGAGPVDVVEGAAVGSALCCQPWEFCEAPPDVSVTHH